MSHTEVAQNLRKFHINLIDSVLEQWYTKNALNAAQESIYPCELLHFVSHRPKAGLISGWQGMRLALVPTTPREES